ncbi:ImmA/IrrE family metallo-endopeptidase [Paenibacillus sp. TAB 01]|uniref:ImmA/IrrE family metallo-endopeptidase n=1 Tax=Paenibacillus sp. TAB 01 TaxID=3368988 RepID=UPI0037515D7E
MIFKIGGMYYKVQEEEKIQYRYEVLGQVDYLTGEIVVDNKLDINRKNQTIAHELLHGMLFEAGYKEQDEDLVHRLGIVFYQFLKDNDLSVFKEEADL